MSMASLLPRSSHSYAQGEEELSGQFQDQETLGEAAEVGGTEAEDQEASGGLQHQVTGVKRGRMEDQDFQEPGQTSGDMSSHDDNASTLASTSNSKKTKITKPRGRKPKGEKVERKSTKRVKKEVETPPKATPEIESQEGYTDTSSNQEVLDSDQPPHGDVSLSEETFEDPSQLYYSMNTTYEEGNSSTSMEPFQDLEPMSSSENIQNLGQSQLEEAESADASPKENQDEVFDEKTEGKIENGERYYCEFEGCNKSYTHKANRGTHQKKAHGLLGSRAAKKQRMSVSATEEEQKEEPSVIGNNDQEEPEPNAESLTATPPEYTSFTENSGEAAPAADEFNNPVSSADINEEIGPISSFLTDSSLGFDAPDHDVFQAQESSNNEVEGGFGQSEASHQAETEASNAAQMGKEAEVDVSNSKYFQKNPKMMQTAREKSCLLFTEVPDNLPTGWKFRSVEVRNARKIVFTNILIIFR